MTNPSFDYIICGGGTAGCLIASRLAKARPEVAVLLVEAGRDAGLAPDVLVPGKYVHQLSADQEGLWQLPTVPQTHLNNRTLTFLRGKQLGGSSAVNYMAMARGPAADFDAWAKLTGDDSWSWNNVLPLMRQLEDFRPERPVGFEEYAAPMASHHGVGGPIKIGFGHQMVPGVQTFFQACLEHGMETCPDNNSGNPIGVGLAQFNVGNGERSYAANAFLDPETRLRLTNLTILPNTSCDKVRFEGPKAVGVDLFHRPSGETFPVDCRREIILCSGTFSSPQILMMSGVGPSAHLRNLGIPVVCDLPSVGQNMLDHSILSLEYQVDDKILAHNQIFAIPKLLAEAEASYAKDRTGGLSLFGTSGAVAFPQIKRLQASEEFAALSSEMQEYMSETSRPSAEIWLGSGPSVYSGEVRPEESYMTHELLLQNNLSRGSVMLSSRNPRAAPIINPNFLDHPYDARIAIETVREAMSIAKASAYRNVIKRIVHGPGEPERMVLADEPDDNTIMRFVRENLGQGYHSLGTCKMGAVEDATAVVGPDFKVVGIEGLRVADLSVCPVLTCNHTQINAYLIGEKCVGAIMESWSQMSTPLDCRL